MLITIIYYVLIPIGVFLTLNINNEYTRIQQIRRFVYTFFMVINENK